MPLRPALLALALSMLAACAAPTPAPQRAGVSMPPPSGIVPLTLEQDRQLRE